MSKMNRRDYLRQMGAAGAILGVSGLFSSPAKATEVQKTVPQTTTPPAFLFTPKTATPPGPTNLTVLFEGIMGFSNTNGGVAQVGFQKGKGKHKLEINLYQTIGGLCYKYPSISSAGVKTMELEIPGAPASVNFFHKEDFERTMGDDARNRDFGWVLDFEDSLLYPGGVNIKKKFSPVLTLKQGTFYTHQLTNSKFDLIDVDDHNKPLVSLNQVPRLIGAAIDIPAGNSAVLRVNGKIEASLPQIAGVRYELQFMNECYNGSDHCKWQKPKDPDEETRNDFYMHYLMFNPKSSSANKRGVIMREQVTGGRLDSCPADKMAATDEAPCMGGGFGRQTGFQPGP